MGEEPPPIPASSPDLALDIFVHVNRPSGTLVKIPISKDSPVSKLKEAISANCGTPSLSQKLVHKTTVMHNDDVIGSFSDDVAVPLEVTMIQLPLGGLLQSMEALGLTKRVDAVPSPVVRDMLATLASSVEVSELPAHVTDWFEILLENGIVLTYWDPRECLSRLHLNSPGLLCLFWTEEPLGPCAADELCMLDVADGDGLVSVHSDFDATHINCAEWKEKGKLEQSWGGLSEYFMFKAEKQSEKIQAASEHDKLTQFGKCLKVNCMLPSASGEGYELTVMTPEFTPELEAGTVSALKGRLSEMTSVDSGKMRVICAGKEVEDSRLLTDYGIKGGHTVSLVVRK